MKAIVAYNKFNKTLMMIAAILAGLFIFVGCAVPASVSTQLSPGKINQFAPAGEPVVISNDLAYIPINKSGPEAVMLDEVRKIVQEWESDNRDLEVTYTKPDWEFSWFQNVRWLSVNGIEIHSRPKATTTPTSYR